MRKLSTSAPDDVSQLVPKVSNASRAAGFPRFGDKLGVPHTNPQSRAALPQTIETIARTRENSTRFARAAKRAIRGIRRTCEGEHLSSDSTRHKQQVDRLSTSSSAAFQRPSDLQTRPKTPPELAIRPRLPMPFCQRFQAANCRTSS